VGWQGDPDGLGLGSGAATVTTTRQERLEALANLHSEWVGKNLAKASKVFDPSGRKKGSDYNQHHVDLDADGEAQDAFADAAMALFPVRAKQQVSVREVVAAELERLAGHDVTPGHDELHHYWTKGPGLAKWVHSAHPWTALYHHLVKYVNPEMAKRMASAWFHEVLGFWPGTPHVGVVPTPKAGRSAQIHEIVAAELARMAGFNPLQPRGPDGKWIKGDGSAKKAIKAAVRARILTPKQAHEMQQRMTADRPWMPHQRKALQDYSANEYLLMNSRLRGVTPRAYDQAITDPDPAATDKRIKDVADSLRPLPEPVRVFRNAYAADGLGLLKSYSRRELVERLRTLVGQTREDKGFTSTSIKRLKDDKFGDVRLDIDVPAGMPGAFIESITAKKHEQELVLGRGMRFEILSLDESGYMPVLKVRVVPA